MKSMVWLSKMMFGMMGWLGKWLVKVGWLVGIS